MHLQIPTSFAECTALMVGALVFVGLLISLSLSLPEIERTTAERIFEGCAVGAVAAVGLLGFQLLVLGRRQGKW